MPSPYKFNHVSVVYAHADASKPYLNKAADIYISLLVVLWRDVLVLGDLSAYVKVSHKRPGVAQRFPGSLGSQIFMIFDMWRW